MVKLGADGEITHLLVPWVAQSVELVQNTKCQSWVITPPPQMLNSSAVTNKELVIFRNSLCICLHVFSFITRTLYKIAFWC